jgi:hypothetical protein
MEQHDNENKLSESQFVRYPSEVIYNPIWDNIANNLGKGALILNDCDMMVCNYKKRDLFFYFEIKKQGIYMDKPGQFSTHYIMDRALRRDPDCNYAGLYILWHLGKTVGVQINYTRKLLWNEFYKFLRGDLLVEPFDIEASMKRSGMIK